MMWSAVTIVFCAALLPAEVDLSDSAVFVAFRRADPQLTQFVTLQRSGVTEALDLVIAMGSPDSQPFGQVSVNWWTEVRKIGLFLQDKAQPSRVYALGSRAGFADCAMGLERATGTDTVVSCKGEKPSNYPHQKWVYDVRAKRLVAQFAYQPYATLRTIPSAGRSVFVVSDNQRQIAVEYKADKSPAFRILGEAEAKRFDANRETKPFPTDVPALPRTTYEEFAAARPQRVSEGFKREVIDLKDTIGPWQREGSRIWFGKNFYDGEGSTGVGGFGYFDTAEHKIRVFNPPELVDWSVSALDVQPDAIWMALVYNTEYGGSAGGVLRYDRQTETIRRFPLPDIAHGIVQAGGKTVIATNFGFAVIDGDQLTRYFIDRTTDGRLRIAAATVLPGH